MTPRIASTSTVTTPDVVMAETGAIEVGPDGTISGDMPPVPLSSFLSDETKAALAEMLNAGRPSAMNDGIEGMRRAVAERSGKIIDEWLDILAVDVNETAIDGVRVHIVEHSGGASKGNENRVLINAHSVI